VLDAGLGAMVGNREAIHMNHKSPMVRTAFVFVTPQTAFREIVL